MVEKTQRAITILQQRQSAAASLRTTEDLVEEVRLLQSIQLLDQPRQLIIPDTTHNSVTHIHSNMYRIIILVDNRRLSSFLFQAQPALYCDGLICSTLFVYFVFFSQNQSFVRNNVIFLISL